MSLDDLIADEIARPEAYELLPVGSKRSALEWPEWLARRYKPGLTAAAVAYRLASYWNAETGDAWPSYPRIAEDLSCGERAVGSAVARLESLGVVLIDRHPNSSNRYTLLRATLILGERVAGDATPGGTSDHPGSHDVPPRVARGASEPVRTLERTRREPARARVSASPPAPEQKCARHLLPLMDDGACRGCRADQLAGEEA